MVYGTCLTLNLAAEAAGVGAAVLIRALEPTEGIDLMLKNRPGSRLRRPGARTRASVRGVGHRPRAVGRRSRHASALWLERTPGAPAAIQVTTRIGLSRDQHRRLRFIERGSPFVSVPP